MSKDVHRESSDIFFQVQNVLKNITTFLKVKMFLLCLNQDEKLFNKLNISFLFSPFPSNIEIQRYNSTLDSSFIF